MPLSERAARARTAAIAVVCCAVAFGAATVRNPIAHGARAAVPAAWADAMGPVQAGVGQSVADLDRTRVQRDKTAGAQWLAEDRLPVPSPEPEPPAAVDPLHQPAPPSAPTAASSTPPEPPPAQPPASRGAIGGVGDSIMLAASSRLAGAFGSRIAVDAVSGRQVEPGVNVARDWAAADAVADTVVIHLGTNGTFSRAQFDAMMAAVSRASRVLFVNVKVPRPWESGVNATIHAGVQRHARATLIDWQAAATAHPEYLSADGYHLSHAGLDAYAALIARAVG